MIRLVWLLSDRICFQPRWLFFPIRRCDGQKLCLIPVDPDKLPLAVHCDDSPKYVYVSYVCEEWWALPGRTGAFALKMGVFSCLSKSNIVLKSKKGSPQNNKRESNICVVVFCQHPVTHQAHAQRTEPIYNWHNQTFCRHAVWRAPRTRKKPTTTASHTCSFPNWWHWDTGWSPRRPEDPETARQTSPLLWTGLCPRRFVFLPLSEEPVLCFTCSDTKLSAGFLATIQQRVKREP